MDINFNINSHNKLLVEKFVGHITLNDLRKYKNKLFGNPEFKLIDNILTDMRKITVDCKSRDVVDVIGFILNFRYFFEFRKHAVILDQIKQPELAKYVGYIFNEANMDHRIMNFTNFTAAHMWVVN